MLVLNHSNSHLICLLINMIHITIIRNANLIKMMLNNCDKWIGRNNMEIFSKTNNSNTNNRLMFKIPIVLNRWYSRIHIFRPIRKLAMQTHEKYNNFLIKIILISSRLLLRLRNFNFKIIRSINKAVEIAIIIMNQKTPRSRSRESLKSQRCRRIHRIKFKPCLMMKMKME